MYYKMIYFLYIYPHGDRKMFIIVTTCILTFIHVPSPTVIVEKGLMSYALLLTIYAINVFKLHFFFHIFFKNENYASIYSQRRYTRTGIIGRQQKPKRSTIFRGISLCTPFIVL